MKLLRATQFSSVMLVCVVAMLGAGSAQPTSGPPLAATSAAVPQLVGNRLPVRAFPQVHLWRGLDLTYVGMFSPDALYRTTSRMTAMTGSSPGEGIPAAGSKDVAGGSAVPVSMLISVERVVESLEPPAHAQAAAQGHSPAGRMRSEFMAHAFGHPSVLYTPRHITTDSQQRVVLSDPPGCAVHVLDPKGRTSFRIMCGEGHRLQQPEGVAVDGNDDIYVADSQRGLVVVFSRNGDYVRDIGNFRGEPEFAAPHGIAIDQSARRLYVADTPRNLVVVLDLDGHVLRQLGRLHNGTGDGEFDHPTDIAVNHKHVFILDRRGTRVQVFDRSSHLLHSFELAQGIDMNPNGENGLGADREGNVYVSWPNSNRVWVYTDDGRLLCSFGQPGTRVGEFVGPGGLWIDDTNRLYVADSGNGRVQLFQLIAAK